MDDEDFFLVELLLLEHETFGNWGIFFFFMVKKLRTGDLEVSRTGIISVIAKMKKHPKMHTDITDASDDLQ
jgi:hypothetical protein